MSYPVATLTIELNNTGSGKAHIVNPDGGESYSATLHSGVQRPLKNLIEFLQEHIECNPISHAEGEKVRGSWHIKMKGSEPKLKPTSISNMLFSNPVQPWWKHMPLDAKGHTAYWTCKHDKMKWYYIVNGHLYCTNGQHKPKPSKDSNVLTKKDVLKALYALEKVSPNA